MHTMRPKLVLKNSPFGTNTRHITQKQSHCSMTFGSVERPENGNSSCSTDHYQNHSKCASCIRAVHSIVLLGHIAMHSIRCGLLLQMWPGLSVCLSVRHVGEPCKIGLSCWIEEPSIRWGRGSPSGSCWTKEPSIRWGRESPQGKPATTIIAATCLLFCDFNNFKDFSGIAICNVYHCISERIKRYY